MARTLFHGPFGAGQSSRARDAVCAAAEAGVRDILYVVANSTARLAVRSELVRRCGAVFGLRVVTLTGLSREIERRARASSIPIVSGLVEEILTERAIRTVVRNLPDASAAPGAAGGLARAAARTIRQVERGGGTRESFGKALRAIGRPDRNARILLDAWAELERLRQPGTRTPAEAQRCAVEILREHGEALFGIESFVVLEDLPLFGQLDRDLVSVLLVRAQCPVVATSECAQQLESAPATRAYRLLGSLAEWDARVCSPDADPMAGAVGRVFGPPARADSALAPAVRIRRLEAAGETGEVRLAARVVKRHLRTDVTNGASAGHAVRASDILIVARGARYRELICEIFAEHGIGVNATPGGSTAESPIGSALLGLLRLAANSDGGTRDDALGLLRMPHLDLGVRAADRLARRVITRGYLGVDGWDERALRGLGARATNRVKRLQRALAAARESLKTAQSNREMVHMVRRLAKELRLVGNAYFARERAVKGGQHSAFERQLADRTVREDNQSWETVEGILDDTMPDLLRADAPAVREWDVPFAERWLSLFARALGEESTHRAVDGDDLVRIAGTANGDGQPAKVTIILGLRQQHFPLQPRQNAFLRDRLCEQLRAYSIDVITSEDVADTEREAFARAIATAQESLYLSYPATDMEGKPAVASFFMDDLQRAVGKQHQFGIERLGVADVAPSPEDATSRSELLAAIALGVWQRLPATTESRSARGASFAAWNTLLTMATSVRPITDGRLRPLLQSHDRNAMKSAPHSTLELSASQLKLIQHCTFQHFVEKVLRPVSIVAPEYDALVKGSLVHEAMVQWVRLDGWRRGAEALKELDHWFERRAERLPPSSREGRLARFMIDEDRDRLSVFVREELDATSSVGAAKPTYNELAFGERMSRGTTHDAASIAAAFEMNVNTSLGARVVRFSGSIDRVDTYESHGAIRGVALDYKTGATSEFYSKAMLDGKDLQVRLYLLALERLWNIKAEGALYVGFGDGVRRGAISEDAVDRIGDFDRKHVKVMSADEWEVFVHSDTEQLIRPLIERLVTFDIIARPDGGDCGFCDLAMICRYNPYELAALNA